jgi:two-component system, NarL family, response regulator
MANKIRVLLADDHAIVRMGILSLLESESDILVVGQAKNGVDAIAEAARCKPDVAVVDLMMPRKDGVATARELIRHHPEIGVVILTSFSTSDDIYHALEAGALGAVLKSDAENELPSAIRTVFAGQQCISAEIRRQMKIDPPLPALSPRQRDILNSISRGFTNRDIATQLGIGIESVNEHVNAILRKLDATNRTEAAIIAERKHLLRIS